MKKTNLFFALALVVSGGMMAHLAHGIEPQGGAEENDGQALKSPVMAVDHMSAQENDQNQNPVQPDGGDIIMDSLKEAVKESIEGALSSVVNLMQRTWGSATDLLGNLYLVPIDLQGMDLRGAV